MMYRIKRRGILLSGVLAWLVAAFDARAAIVEFSQVDTFYGEADGPFTLVIGEGAPGRGVVAPKVLEFRAADGRRVRVYADRPVSLQEGQSALDRSRRAEAAVRRVRRLKGEQP